MEGQFAAIVASGQSQLTVQRLLINTNTHGRNLEATLQNRVPHQNIAVQFPVIIVGSAAVVLGTGLQNLSDLHQEHGVVLTADGILALIGSQIGIHVLQFLRGDEEHLTIQLAAQAGEGNVQCIGGFTDSAHDGTDGGLQIVHIAVLAGDDLLPVPLIHVDGVNVVHFLIAADSVHIGIEALTLVETVTLQRKALPLSQRVHNLAIHTHIGNVKLNCALHTVQVIIQTGIIRNKQRSRHTAQIQCIAQIGLKRVLNKCDGPLQFIVRQGRGVTLGNVQFAHENLPFPF